MREICNRVGVALPTLYHFFGSKDGLLDAVVEHGFDMFMDVKQANLKGGDPIEEIRSGWDAHVAFGVANPGFYALMYGQVAPGSRPVAQERAAGVLLAHTAAAESQGALVVSAEQAAAHVLAGCVGVTLRQIVDDRSDPALSAAMREATLAAITGVHGTTDAAEAGVAESAASLYRALSGNEHTALAEPEEALLKYWLLRLARG